MTAFAARLSIVLLFLLVAALGAVGGVLVAFSDDLPEISALDNYRPNTITRILASNGEVIGEFATERRLVVRYSEIAPVLRQAILATEDADFEQHFGLSISRIFITAVKDVLTGQRAGASTITQQLARNLFLQGQYMRGGIYERRGWAGIERKVKEAILAVQLEKRYTKQEIFAFYANQVPLHGAYGVESGARLFFNKSASTVTLDEAATLAAIIQAPARLSPFVNPTRTLARRNNYVLPRMVEEGFITAAQAKAAMARPVASNTPRGDRSQAAYFVEDVRQQLEEQFGAAAIYENGLRVATTLDAGWQREAEQALDGGLRRIDKRRGRYRRPTRNVKTHPADAEAVAKAAVRAGSIVPAVVVRVAEGRSPTVVRMAAGEVELPRTAHAWAGAAAKGLFDVGDLIEVGVGSVTNGMPGNLTLEQTPIIEGAVVALDNRTGQVRVMIGGQSFVRSKFNRATQARRQVGSLFKPVVYATALDQGFTATSTFIDEPVSYDAGPKQPPYRPLNYDRKFEGQVTLRRALEQSRNIPAVKAMEAAGPAAVVASAKRLGLTGNYQPYLSLALGAAESTLLEMTSAYSTFAHQGVRMQPYGIRSVTDREGSVLFEARPQPHEAMKADTSFLMAYLLRGVVERGTAQAAQALEWPFAGKTGTMDEYTDAWFIGFDADVTVGVWVGYDEKRSLGYGETGASAALPIWMDVMRSYLSRLRDRTNPPVIEAPGNIVFVTLPSGQSEAFITGTQPEGLLPEDEGISASGAPVP